MNIFKPHPNIHIRTTVNLNLSAEQWSLRTDKFPRVIIEKVADYLNKRVTIEYNKGEPIEGMQVGYNSLRDRFEIYVTPDTDLVFKSVTDTLYTHNDEISLQVNRQWQGGGVVQPWLWCWVEHLESGSARNLV